MLEKFARYRSIHHVEKTAWPSSTSTPAETAKVADRILKVQTPCKERPQGTNCEQHDKGGQSYSHWPFLQPDCSSEFARDDILILRETQHGAVVPLTCTTSHEVSTLDFDPIIPVAAVQVVNVRASTQIVATWTTT